MRSDSVLAFLVLPTVENAAPAKEIR